MELRKHLKLDDIVESNNIAEKMDPDDVHDVGQMILAHYTQDKQSRAEWEDRYAEAMKLVMQLREERTFPWQGASNAKFPLLTIAALQYHARAYPALVRGTQPVQCRVIGDDPDGKKQERAKRVSAHMSFQVMEEDESWEEAQDKALIVQSILGCAFKKTYYDSGRQCVVSELVLPKDLVIDYWAKSLETAPRLTHVIGLYQDEIEERRRRGMFLKENETANGVNTTEYNGAASVGTQREMPPTGPIEDAEDEISGRRPTPVDEDTPVILLEQQMLLDLDGDGYREPYIGTVRYDTGELLRLVARFEKDRIETDPAGLILKITPEKYFTKLPFVPSPDGSIYDMGFGMLLGATNEVINTLVNQLTDAGTMSNLGGGFLARGIRVRGGEYSFRPNEWKRTDSTAEDIHKGIYPLPVREPSPVLFQLLNLMIDWGSRIGMATDAATGQNPGQNQKVGTTQAVIEQGEKVFNGIYKRSFRSLRDEFRLIYRLNYLRKPPTGKFPYASDGTGPGGVAYWDDYFETDKSVVPSADPSIASREMLLQRDMQVRAMAQSMPGYNRYEIDRRILTTLEVPAIDKILPPPGSKDAPPPPPPPPAVQVAQIKAQMEEKKLGAGAQHKQAELVEEQRLNAAKIMQLQAQSAVLMQEAGIAENDKMIGLIDAEIRMAKQYQEQLESLIEGHGKLLEQLNPPQQGAQNGQPAANPNP